VATPAQLVDVAPTVLALTGVERHAADGAAALPGASLFGLPEEPRALYAETYYPRLHFGWSELTSLVRDRFHYIGGPDPELYDLAADFEERSNVLRQERRAYAELRDAMGGFQRELLAPGEVDAATARGMAALGYLGGTVRTAPGEVLADPKSQLPSLADFETGTRLAAEGKFEAAVPPLRRLLERNPKMVDGWERLAVALQKTGRLEDSLAAYQQALQLSGGSAHLAVGTGSVLLALGRLDEAKAHAELGLAANPKLANSLLAQVELAAGRPAEAEKAARLAIAAPGGSIAPLLTLAQVQIASGQLDAALASADEAAAELGRTGAEGQAFEGIQLTRGEALARLGRAEEAEQAFRRELEAFPRATRAYSSLAMLYVADGRPADAVATLRKMVETHGGSPAAYAEAVRTLRAVGDPEGAGALLRHALANHPNSPELRALAG
jgi:Flp pilus assembly protein TadD